MSIRAGVMAHLWVPSGRSRIPAVCVSIGFALAGIAVSAAAGPATPPAATYSQPVDPKVANLLRDAGSALKTGNLNLAIIQLKSAVQLAPKQGEPRARLGMALLQQPGSAPAAERELRQARRDGAPDALVVPGILSAMLLRGKTKELLTEFTDPPSGATGSPVVEILRARAAALQSERRTAEAIAAADRAVKLRRDVPTLLVRARFAVIANDSAVARQLTAEARKADPDSEDVLISFVSLLRQSGEFQKALAQTDEFLKRHAASIAARGARIELLLDLNDDVHARQESDTLLKQAPNAPIAHFYGAVLAARRTDFKEAWQQAQRLPPQFVQSQPSVATQVAQIATAVGHPQIGAAILASLLSRDPEVLQARLQLAGIELREKHPEAALDTLKSVRDSGDSRVDALLGQAYLQLRRYADAAAALQKAAPSFTGPANEFLQQQLAMSELAIGNADEGIQGLEQLAARDSGNVEVAAQLSMALLRAGKLNDALTAVDRLAKAQPKGPLAPFYRGMILAAQSKLSDASTAFGVALTADPKFIPALLYRADVSLARGRPEEATKDLQRALDEDPANFPAYVGLARMALDDGRDSQAEFLLRKAVSLNSKNPAARLALANYQFSRREYQAALSTIAELLQLLPGNAEAMALKGQVQIASGAQKDGIATLRSVATANRQSAAAQLLLGNGLFATGDIAGAETVAANAVELEPSSVQARSLLIQLQIANGKSDAAITTARAFASEHAGSAADALLADTMLRLKRGGEAYALLEKSLAKDPDASMVLRLSQISVAQGDSKRAFALLGGWLGKHPADFDVRLQYATFLLRFGDRAEARREFETLLNQRPENPIVLNNLGWLIQDQDPGRARSLVALAARIAPRSPEIIDTLGWLAFQHHDVQGSVPLLKRAHDLNGDDPEIGYHLAVALDATGKRPDAKTLLNSVLAKNTKFDDEQNARQLLAHW